MSKNSNILEYNTIIDLEETRLGLLNPNRVKKEIEMQRISLNVVSENTLVLGFYLYEKLNTQFAQYTKSEKEKFYKYLEKANSGDLILFDQLYPRIALIFLLNAIGIDFCLRIKKGLWANLKEKCDHGEKDRLIKLKLPMNDQEVLSNYPQMFNNEIECRVVRIDLENGKSEILCTSLTDIHKINHDDFVELYSQQWNNDEGVKLFKTRRKIIEYNSRNTISLIKKSIFKKILMISLCANLAFHNKDMAQWNQ